MDNYFGIGEYGALTALVLATGFVIYLITSTIKTWVAAWSVNQAAVRAIEKDRLESEEKQTRILDKLGSAVDLMVTKLEQSTIERASLSKVILDTKNEIGVGLTATQNLLTVLQDEKQEHMKKTDLQHDEVMKSLEKLETTMDKVTECVRDSNHASEELRTELTKLRELIGEVCTSVKEIVVSEENHDESR